MKFSVPMLSGEFVEVPWPFTENPAVATVVVKKPLNGVPDRANACAGVVASTARTSEAAASGAARRESSKRVFTG